MAANFTEFGAEESVNSWTVTLRHAEMTRSSVVRSRARHVRCIWELAGRQVKVYPPRMAHGRSCGSRNRSSFRRPSHHVLFRSPGIGALGIGAAFVRGRRVAARAYHRAVLDLV